MTDMDMKDWALDDHGDGLRIGRRYAVQLRDCCVEGTFEATLAVARWGYDDKATPEGEPIPLTALVFDNRGHADHLEPGHVHAGAERGAEPMIDVRFRPIPVWPYPSTADRRWAPFRSGWRETLQDLDHELAHLRASNVIIGAGFREGDIRNDGWPRADAKTPNHPGVEVSFDTPKMGRLVYATDSCRRWEDNVRSIALGLAALRAVDRYGITRKGEQYAGWKALSAQAVGGLTTGSARKILRDWADPQIDGDLRTLYRSAVKRTHPDTAEAGGSRVAFEAVQAAGKLPGVA